MILFLLACSQKPDGNDSKPGPEDTAPVPYLLDDETAPEPPTFEPATIEASVDEAIAVFLAIDPAPVIAAYDALVSDAEGGCPAWYSSDGMPYWYDNCTTSGGTEFQGYGYRITYDGFDDGGTTWNGGALGVAGSITASDGTTFEMNGGAYDMVGTIHEGKTQVAYTILQGDIFFTGNPDAGLVPAFSRTVYTLANGGVGILADGSVTGLEGDMDTVAFDNVYLLDQITGLSDCSEEPSGIISVRETTGEWIDLVFDPQVHDMNITTSGDGCDGCAAAWSGSTYLGEACADFSPWLQ